MTPEQERAFLATLSEHVYDPDRPLPGRWQLLDTAFHSSGFQAAAYQHPISHQVVVVYRGTDEGKDWLA